MAKKQSTKRKNNANVATKPSDGKNSTTSTNTSKSSGVTSSSFPSHLLQDRKKSLLVHPILHEEKEEAAQAKIRKSNSFSSDVATIHTLYPNAVFVAKNVLSKLECNAWIEHAESAAGFERVSHPATRIIAHRDCGRIQRDDWMMSERLYQRLKPIIDYVASNTSISNYSDINYEPINCNGNLRLYRYDKGMSFGRHYDGSSTIDQYSNAQTEITVLIYLSSCEGGATRFYPPHSCVGSASTGKKKKKKKNDSAASTKVGMSEEKGGIAYIPEAGSVLFHVHGDRCLLHEADPVISGIKYGE
mmetsp:Transcript_18599/g.26929  ORF Transcript_18599/g.26929 Transcript_18599/m.26929 type:complete len:302 (-) Transcript_18599:659-1564(-)